MKPILETLAEYLVGEIGKDLGESRIILPSRRAVLFLHHHLTRHARETVWAPRIVSIGDFINEASVLQLSDPVSLQLHLYEVYARSVEHPEPMDEFIYWGEMILRDFDELDKYGVDADQLFMNFIDLKELEQPLSGLDEEQIRFIRQFWAGFLEGDPTPEKKKFRDHWNLLPLMYQGIREKLHASNQGYQGMQYREIADRIRRGEFESGGEQKTVVVGFNALNHCEKLIFKWFKERGARFFWDYDLDYVETPAKEAGRFLRKNLKEFPEHLKLEAFNGLSCRKEISVFELSSDVLQAKTLYRILQQRQQDQLRDCTDTAVILCDEELMMPVIMSLPEHVTDVNITMGYPMKSTPVYTFIEQLFRLQENLRIDDEGTTRFYHSDVTGMLLHPFMGGSDRTGVASLLKSIVNNNLIYIERGVFEGDMARKIFRSVEEGGGLLEYLRDIFQQVLEELAAGERSMRQDLDREFVFQLLIQLNRLEKLLVKNTNSNDAVLIRLLYKIMAHIRVPFEGEPLAGLQIMGILETRLLDFRHIILLSMNEEVIPGSHHGQTFLPYALRLAFGMPAREDMDAIYAYYFYRLLQRAERIDLLFNSASEDVRTGEMSRYLTQLIYHRGVKVIRPGMELTARAIPPLVIGQTAETKEKLQHYFLSAPGEKYLSPSAINTYIDCSLKFYLRYIAGIGEADEVQEELDAAGFGTVVHESVRILYDELGRKENGWIRESALKEMLNSDRPGSLLEEVFLTYHSKGRKNSRIEGRNIIIFRVMIRYLRKILETDLNYVPFRIVASEKSYRGNLGITSGEVEKRVRIGGKIDRIDQVEGVFRVIDYKTGHALQGFSSIEDLFDPGKAGRNSAVLQILLYCWLASPHHQKERIEPGIYAVRELYGEDFDPGIYLGGRKRGRKINSYREINEEFSAHLRRLLEKIFDPTHPFIQTENRDICRRCDFASICNRSFIE